MPGILKSVLPSTCMAGVFLWAFLFSASAQIPTGNATTLKEFQALTFDKSHVGSGLDIDKYQRTFFEDFSRMTILAPGGAPSVWYSPVHAPFGAAKFEPPGPDGPFSIKEGILTITARKNETDQWSSGIIESVDNSGRGFSQQYGYFEIRAEFPPGPGSWPAFWLKSVNGYLDPGKTRTEIDIIEWYGKDPKGLHSSVHLWPAAQKGENYPLVKHVGESNYFNVEKENPPVLEKGLLAGFHTYGCEVTPEWVIFYFNRKETGRFKTLPEFRTPLYLLVDLAIFEKEANAAQSPKEMKIDYVAVYQHQ